MIRNSFIDTQIILSNKDDDDDVISTSATENTHGNMDKTKAMFGVSSVVSCAENVSSLTDNRLAVQEVK
jgi:hypothetical protein